MASQLVSKEGITWTHASEPSSEELAGLVRRSDVSALDAEFIAQDHRRSEITVRGDYILILIRIPTFNKKRRVTVGRPLYFIIREQQLWTLAHAPIVVLEKLWQEYEQSEEKREEYFKDGALSLALHVINALYTSSFNKLDRLGKHITIAEDAIFTGNERKMVEEVSVLMRDVLDFRRIMRTQAHLFATPPDHPLVTSALANQWQRLHGQADKVWQILESLLEAVSELRDTNDSLLQHKENQLLRILTYYSIIAIPAWILITPFDPLAEGAPLIEKVVFWAVLGVLVFTLVGIFIRFRQNRVL
jgi:magnesium transporter